MEKDTNIISWDEALKETGFLKLEKGVRTDLVIINFRLTQEMKKKYESEEEELTTVFYADVISKDGEPAELKIGTSSKRMIRALGEHLKNVNPKSTVSFSIKKIGENQGVAYDVENFKVIE